MEPLDVGVVVLAILHSEISDQEGREPIDEQKEVGLLDLLGRQKVNRQQQENDLAVDLRHGLAACVRVI